MESIHLVGIAGSGMLPLAELGLKRGLRMTGSDRLLGKGADWTNVSPPIRKRLDRLNRLGARLYPQDGSGIDSNTARVVISTAIESDNPDWVKAETLAVPIIHRSDELKRQLAPHRLLAVTGANGKSTTTALCAWLLRGVDELACFVGGTEILDTSPTGEGWTSVWLGDGNWACAELDESDKSLLRFEPDIAVILNISRDHHSFEENLDTFEQFAAQVRGTLLLNRSDSGCLKLAERLASKEKLMWFDPPSEDEVIPTPDGSIVSLDGQEYACPLPGYYNAVNLAAAMSLIRLAAPSASHETLKQAVQTFPGVRRRLQRYGSGPITVFDDYAHNPDKIEALLHCLQARFPRVHLVFQPHGYGPLRFHLDGFAKVFSSTLRPEDRLYLLPIYDAGGTTNRSIASEDLAARIQDRIVYTPSSREELIARLRQDTDPGVVIAVAGARDDTLAELAETIAERLAGI